MLLTLTDDQGHVLAELDSTDAEAHEIFNNLALDGQHLLSDEANRKLNKAVDDFYS